MIPATWRKLAALVAATALAGAIAHGGAPRRSPTELDDRVVPLRGRHIGVQPRSIDELQPTDSLRVGWDEFRTRRHGSWEVYIDERSGLPTLVKGRGIQWFAEADRAEVDIAALESAARDFLRQERALLGSQESVLLLDHEASARLRPGSWQLVFRQFVDGIRVDNARLDFHVSRGRLVMFGASHWSTPEISGVPSIGTEQAFESLHDHLGEKGLRLILIDEPELTMIAVDADPALDGSPRAWSGPRRQGLDHVLLWRFHLRQPGDATVWIGEVDAHDGSLRAFYDGTDHVTVSGGVFPVSNDGDCAEGGCEIARFPMPYGYYDEQGQATTTTDGFGNLQCVAGGDPVDVSLSGPYVHIDDVCGSFAETATCQDGADLGIKPGENCEYAPGVSSGNTAAARTSFYHINRAHEATRFYDPGNTWLQSPVTVNVNIDSTCNATWNGDINMWRGGNGCANMGELPGVLLHEWGHGYDQNDGGGRDLPSEGYADVMALFAHRDSCIGRGWYLDGTCDGFGDECLTCTGVRDVDWAGRTANTPANASNWLLTYCDGGGAFSVCGLQQHCEGQMLAEVLYDLAARDLPAAGLDTDTAWQVAERLWYVTRIGSGGDMYFCILPNIYSCGASALQQRLLVADDDDGDLSNGTPHAAAIYAAFDRHDMACGSAGSPANQNSSSCPSLAAPVVSVTELPGGSEVSWGAVSGAAEYRVYRGDLGCDRQQLAIASLTGGQTSWLDADVDPGLPRYYRVEAFGSNQACSSPVSNCSSTPSTPRLQRSAQRFIAPDQQAILFPNPGETFHVAATLFNSGLADALGVQGNLGLVDPAQGQVLDSQVDWGMLPATTQAESAAPHFEVTVSDNVPCGAIVAFDLQAAATNAATATSRFAVRLGEASRDFANQTPEVIPPETITPVVSTIEIDQDWTVAELDVSVATNHDAQQDLIIELTSPQNTTVRLHDRSGSSYFQDTRFDLEREPDGPGTMSDFAGESTQGTWTLSIQDVGTDSTFDRTLEEWTLHMGIVEGWDCVPGACSAPVPTATPDLLVARTSDGGQPRLEFSWTTVPLAAGYNVQQSPVATFDQDVALVGQTDAATTMLTVDDDPGPTLTFFQVRGVNECGDEGP